MDRYLTVHDVERLLSVGPWAARRIAHEAGAVKLGRQLFVASSRLSKLLGGDTRPAHARHTPPDDTAAFARALQAAAALDLNTPTMGPADRVEGDGSTPADARCTPAFTGSTPPVVATGVGSSSPEDS